VALLDVGDALQRIIDHNRQLVGEQTVGTPQYEVAYPGGQPFVYGALQPVGEPDRDGLDTQALGARFASRRQARAAGAGVNRSGASRHGAVADFAAGTGAGVDQASLAQLFQAVLVGIAAPALVKHLAVPVQPNTLEGVQYCVGGARHLARRIQIFHAQQPLAAT
jgi:hypothetical protein